MGFGVISYYHYIEITLCLLSSGEEEGFKTDFCSQHFITSGELIWSIELFACEANLKKKRIVIVANKSNQILKKNIAFKVSCVI